MMKTVIPALVCAFAIPASAQAVKEVEKTEIRTAQKMKVHKPDCDKLGNFEIQDFKKCQKSKYKKDPVCTKLGNFEIQDFKSCERKKADLEPKDDSLLQFEIQR
ncbi:hypothetical protein [Ponticaulis profundi]|uniref:Kazal-like domain-containing protein n=1 Tax=Ponticaulis profundi TaxID=2665222 RepID=A0ABW1S6N0_9PROT